MKKFPKIISLILVLFLVSKTPFVVLADELDSNNTDNSGSNEVVLDESTDDKSTDDESTDDESTDGDSTEDESDDDESDDDESNSGKGNKSNTGLGKLTKEQKKQLQQERKKLREQLKSVYTVEDLERIQEVNNQLREKYNGIKILPIDSIISNRYNFKFDVPPVIKDQRTLVPVRAITETFGCDVTWNSETQMITITKATTSSSLVIEMVLNDNIVKVNGEPIELDTEASLFNNRTFVPLRFLAETFKLEINWYGEDETIEIIETDEDADSDEDSSDEATDSDEDSSDEATDSDEDSSDEATDSDEDSSDESTDSDTQSI